MYGPINGLGSLETSALQAIAEFRDLKKDGFEAQSLRNQGPNSLWHKLVECEDFGERMVELGLDPSRVNWRNTKNKSPILAALYWSHLTEKKGLDELRNAVRGERITELLETACDVLRAYGAEGLRGNVMLAQDNGTVGPMIYMSPGYNAFEQAASFVRGEGCAGMSLVLGSVCLGVPRGTSPPAIPSVGLSIHSTELVGRPHEKIKAVLSLPVRVGERCIAIVNFDDERSFDDPERPSPLGDGRMIVSLTLLSKRIGPLLAGGSEPTAHAE